MGNKLGIIFFVVLVRYYFEGNIPYFAKLCQALG